MIVGDSDFFRTCPWPNEQQSVKHLLFFMNVQNSVGGEMVHLMLNNSEPISETCQRFSYAREDNSSKDGRLSFPSHFLFSILGSAAYYFPTTFHVFVTMSRRTWATENEVYKKFKWIPFKIDSVPWNGLLKRHLWRRMIDM